MPSQREQETRPGACGRAGRDARPSVQRYRDLGEASGRWSFSDLSDRERRSMRLVCATACMSVNELRRPVRPIKQHRRPSQRRCRPRPRPLAPEAWHTSSAPCRRQSRARRRHSAPRPVGEHRRPVEVKRRALSKHACMPCQHSIARSMVDRCAHPWMRTGFMYLPNSDCTATVPGGA